MTKAHELFRLDLRNAVRGTTIEKSGVRGSSVESEVAARFRGLKEVGQSKTMIVRRNERSTKDLKDFHRGGEAWSRKLADLLEGEY